MSAADDGKRKKKPAKKRSDKRTGRFGACNRFVYESDPGSNTEPPRVLGRCTLAKKHTGDCFVEGGPR